MQNDLEYNNTPFINDIEHYKSSSFLEPEVTKRSWSQKKYLSLKKRTENQRPSRFCLGIKTAIFLRRE